VTNFTSDGMTNFTATGRHAFIFKDRNDGTTNYMIKITGMILAALLLLLPSVSQAFQVDRVEAVVNGKVITRSEVERALEVEALRQGVNTEEAVEKLRGEVLNTLIDRTLLLGEARRFNIVSVSEEEVEKALETVKKKFGTEDEFQNALKEDDMTVEELKDDLRDQILAAKYVDRRVKFFIRVTLDEQKNYYLQNRDKFAGKEFDEVNDEIYNLLVEKETDKKLEEYIKDLRAKSEIIIKGGKDNSFVK
jgi:parvulin-like peptidyl-prolyl isomerase